MIFEIVDDFPSFSSPVMRTHVHATGNPSVAARGRGPARGPKEAEESP